MQLLLAALVRLIHIALILGVVATPFVTRQPELLLLHVTFMAGMMVHWYFGSTGCVLTALESRLRGVPAENTFVFSVIAPVYSVPFTMSQQRLLIWVVSLLLFSRSLALLISNFDVLYQHVMELF